jgi:superfamily II DNA/RNA helicase
MLDTGFEPDIRKLEELGIPPKDERFTSMFSATFPDEVQKLAKHFLRNNYIFLAVGTPGGANEDIAQTIEEVPQGNKKDRLLQLLEQNLSTKNFGKIYLNFLFLSIRRRTLFNICRNKTFG